MDIKEKIKDFPLSPGVYLMKDDAGTVIYVGKAAQLKKRVASYFQKPHGDPKTAALVERIHDIEVRVTGSEHEAFLLEAQLIKKFKPHFNISLKDDKSFPFIKITKEDFPRVFIGRKKPGENVDYFGPYTNSTLLREILKALRKVFPFCTCRNFFKKPCLNYHLGLCLAPCSGAISRQGYRKMVGEFKFFLENGKQGLMESLKKRMKECSENHRFEEALQLRERIRGLSLLFTQSKNPLAESFREFSTRRIEAFDISNLFGKEAVGSMVTFVNGKPSKNDYRRFRIRMVHTIDDYQMIREVLLRRYRRVLSENLERPTLVVIDGGKGHLHVAAGVLKELGLELPIIAIAKEEELIYTVAKHEPIAFEKDNPTLQVIQRARDEAHRFALAYHRLLRKKKHFNNTDKHG